MLWPTALQTTQCQFTQWRRRASSTWFPHWMQSTILALIIRTAKNNYYNNRSALNRKQLNYARVMFEYIRAVLPPVSETKMEWFLTTTKAHKAVHHAQWQQQRTCLRNYCAVFHPPGFVRGVCLYTWYPRIAELKDYSAISAAISAGGLLTTCLRSVK